MISLKLNNKIVYYNLWALLFIILIIALLMISLNLNLEAFTGLRVSVSTMIQDLIYTFLRVTLISLIAWSLAIIGGWLLNHISFIRMITLPGVNFIRHISPFAWFPFAIIWFGLGERPVSFILLVTLFFPALIAIREMFADIDRDYLDEAKVCGAKSWQLFYHIELPLIMVSLINFFRILWGLGWTVVIAAEMLGTAVGLGYRLLDFRYLLFYEEMIVYLIIMGVVGILIDKGLYLLVKCLRKRNSS
ncbi:MAG: ABC transporter permease subunit [Candidatus Cloacimonetes bacterium]|nr:ABC transporter permease subunit [Candidatus Cloacimonadota bacterium]